MMGHRSKRFKLFTETNLDALLPADNFYRRLEEKLDLSFVRDLVRDCYEEKGRPSSINSRRERPSSLMCCLNSRSASMAAAGSGRCD